MNGHGASLDTLEDLCKMMEYGATIEFMSDQIDRSMRTVLNYLAVLNEAHVSYTIFGKGTKGDPKRYQLDITLNRSKILLKKHFSAKYKKPKSEKPNQVKHAPLGVGISRWLFLTRDRAIAYADWSGQWTKD